MKFNVNLKAGISIEIVFEGENKDNRVLTYAKDKDLFSGKLGEVYS